MRHAVAAGILGWLLLCTLAYLSSPQNQPFYTTVWSSLFPALERMRFRLPDGFLFDVTVSLVSLLLHSGIGWLFLRACYRLPRAAEVVLSVFLGIGLSNFLMVFPAMAFWLHPATILLTLALCTAILFPVYKRYSPTAQTIHVEIRPFSHSWEPWVFYSAWSILAVITALSFYHALLFPVDYWDALILYIHYGRMTYDQGGFPILACLQVGLGLGANYPHMYTLFQSTTATLVGHWSDIYGQMLPPLAGLGSIVLMYSLCIHLFRNRIVAVLAVLSFRAVPFVTAYFIWASDYALVMLYTTAYLYLLALYLRRPTTMGVHALLLCAAILPHINYLGWIVWPTTGIAILWTRLAEPESPGWRTLFLTNGFWFTLAMIWYVRNWVMTGNPVYAFFPEIFGGININPDVLASSKIEWLEHGNGMAQLGDTLWERLMGSPAVFLFDFRVGPLTAGILLPAFWLAWKNDNRLYISVAVLLFFYWLYQYVISGLYLYHTIAVFPILALYVGRMLSSLPNDRWLFAVSVPLLFAGIAPGISYSLMGTKIPRPDLTILSQPGIDPERYYMQRYPQVSQAWRYLNTDAEPGALILTHDNRYHVYRDDLRVLHLDDCELVPKYDSPYDDIHQELLARGVEYYLQIRGEFYHPITARLGHREYLDNPAYYERILQSGETALYRLSDPAE